MAALTCAIPAYAQNTGVRHYAIPAEPLGTALNQLALTADRQIMVPPDLVRGRTAPALTGSYSLHDALRHVLAGSGLTFRISGSTIVIRHAPTVPAPPDTQPQKQTRARQAPPPKNLQAVIVTGSRIRGAPPASPVIDISQQQMIRAGHTNLGQVIRSIPQNFSGGQNPGVAFGASAGGISNQNITGGSALNLRGLGPDATLTLLNGRRLSYNGFSQAVDISAIPLAAVDRIEIVTTGASAIYGSDAVAGVANVILKRDYQGTSVTGRYGEATDGGDIQRQFNLVTGTRWNTGGFIVALDAENDSGITAGQRDYTSYIQPAASLLATNKNRAGIFSVHQAIGTSATFSVDALYHRREINTISFTGLRFRQNEVDTNRTIAPRLTVKMPAAWNLSISGVYSNDKDFDTVVASDSDGTTIDFEKGCYCNRVSSIEVSADGPLLTLPAGKVRMAVGGGYRMNKFESRYLVPASPSEGGQRHDNYEYVEIFLPLVSSGQDVPFVHELSLSGAARHDDYSDFGSVTTPKIGLIYAPTRDFGFKASWGKSFKAPTLTQEHQTQYAYLYPAIGLGAGGYPATATALLRYGGNPDLQPERAKTWTTTLSVHPHALAGFHAEVGYFHINYNQRVAQPINPVTAAFRNPAFSEFLLFHPTPSQQQSAIDHAARGLTNFTGAPYDPTNVLAIVNDLYTNVTAQQVHGVDFSVGYQFGLGAGSMNLSERASWLTSEQKNTALSPAYDLAGTVYNPPHFRSRFGATWQNGPLVVSGFYNYIGGVLDTQSTPQVHGAAMQTVDLTASYHFPSDIKVQVSVLNAFNRRPPYLQSWAPDVVNYDSTNYSAIGRFVGVAVTKRWK